MTSNGYGHHSNNNHSNVWVLYKVMNTDADKNDPCFNAFKMPRVGRGPTLATVKQHCAALHGLNHLGPEGYHWRVCIEDKPVSGSTERSFSWWDVQDENASLPIKETSPNDLRKLFNTKEPPSSADAATAAAKGAFKSLGKAVSSAVSGGMDGSDGGPSIPVVVFKLLDLVKMHDDFGHQNNGRGGVIPQPSYSKAAPSAATRQPTQQPRQQQSQQQPQYAAPKLVPQQRPNPPPRRPNAAPAPNPATQVRSSAANRSAPIAEPSLMDFGVSSTPAAAPRSFNHMSFSSTSPPRKTAPPINETRAEKLKREYAQKAQTSSRVWDDIDQRWVENEPLQKTTSSSSLNSSSNIKNVGISIDPSNAIGKSASVQAAVNKRVNEMREQQAKALQEVRIREEKKKMAEAEEDIVRRNLEPKIKAWSEEHGKKKQLRALLASLHTILWPGANWKQISLGDVLDDSKIKKFYHKATLVVHPDKTHDLDAEKRFLSKRIFDALTQAKTEFDNGTR